MYALQEWMQGGNTGVKSVSSRLILPFPRFAIVLMVITMITGTLMWVGPQSASAKQAQQLSTCLNLATGANRVLVRGACDSVLEMTQVWDQVSVDEPVGKFFSARTLALAVLLNTGGDVSKFTKKDWVSLARLQAANQAKINSATISSATRAKTASVQEVRAVVTTCVLNTTGASRVLVSGQCQKRIETERSWVSLDPPQKPPINDGTPDIPQIEDVSVVGPTSRVVTFKPPVMVGSSPIRSITVIAIPGGQWVTVSGGTGGTALFTGLSPDITYTFLAVAVNDSGAGPRVPSQRVGSRPEPSSTPDPTPSPSPSPSVSTGTGGGSPVTATAPGAPTSVVATAGSTQASVAFTAPTSTGGASITSYTVTSSPGGRSASGSSSPIVVTGLTNGTAYTFTVTATNSVGTGSASVASSGVTPKLSQSITFANPGTKSFGTTPTLSASSDSSLTVAFTSATSGVCTITTGGVLAFVTAGTCTINADQVGNSNTLAATQVTQSFTVSAVAPGAPTIGTATASSGQTSVAFTAPASTGGASITSYTVTSSLGGFTGSGSSSPIVVTGLTNGTAYTFTVTATNSSGTSSSSSASSSVTPIGVPAAATSVSGTSGNTTAALTWVAPTITGGSAITGYSVQVSTSSGGSYSDAVGCTAAATSTGLSCTATGLTNGTAYYFKVAAINTAGTGPFSSASAAVTPAMTYALGDIGPGGGKVFYVASVPFTSSGSACDTSCRYLEMAKKTWRSVSDPSGVVCDTPGNFTTIGGTAIGSGFANTSAIDVACSTGVGQWVADYAVTVSGVPFLDWFLASSDELNTMYLYKPSIPSGSEYEFGTSPTRYWTSSFNGGYASCQYFNDGVRAGCIVLHSYLARPIRAF